MAEPLVFTTPKRNTDPKTFILDGREYVFTPPKSAEMVLPNYDLSASDLDRARAPFNWLSAGLSEEDVAYLWSRMKDPADDFDINDLGPIIDGLAEQVAGDRPTT